MEKVFKILDKEGFTWVNRATLLFTMLKRPEPAEGCDQIMKTTRHV